MFLIRKFFKKKIQLYKMHLAFLSRQTFFAKKIQRCYRKHINSRLSFLERTLITTAGFPKIIMSYFMNNFIYSNRTVKNLLIFRQFDITLKGETLLINFFGVIKPIITLRIKLLKVIAKSKN